MQELLQITLTHLKLVLSLGKEFFDGCTAAAKEDGANCGKLSELLRNSCSPAPQVVNNTVLCLRLAVSSAPPAPVQAVAAIRRALLADLLDLCESCLALEDALLDAGRDPASTDWQLLPDLRAAASGLAGRLAWDVLSAGRVSAASGAIHARILSFTCLSRGLSCSPDKASLGKSSKMLLVNGFFFRKK